MHNGPEISVTSTWNHLESSGKHETWEGESGYRCSLVQPRPLRGKTRGLQTGQRAASRHIPEHVVRTGLPRIRPAGGEPASAPSTHSHGPDREGGQSVGPPAARPGAPQKTCGSRSAWPHRRGPQTTSGSPSDHHSCLRTSSTWSDGASSTGSPEGPRPPPS